MKRYKINYDENKNCFDTIKNISSQLVWGDLSYVQNPFFTYTIPAYKRAYLLKETLYSVLNQLSVNFRWDIIVVDNEAGGENETERIIREINNPRILYYRNSENIGVDGNYNRCIELARGRWIAMLHADDLIMNDHLRIMGHYIREQGYGRKALAYISPQYIEFSGKEKILLERPESRRGSKDILTQKLIKEDFKGKLKRFRQIDGALSGYSVGLPSFGTVMNRRIMLQSGGFNEELGICEDIIIPYKLAGIYKVYRTPKIMGYYRFENNESMKVENILKIYASMVDFREYMYARNCLTRIWGQLARNELNRVLAEYCVQLSRFSKRRLKKEDFISIYRPEKQSWISLKTFQLFMGVYEKLQGTDTFEEGCYKLLENVEDTIQKRKKESNEFIIYGAGRAAKYTIRYLKKEFPDIHILCVAVSEVSENVKKYEGIPVKSILEMKRKRNSATVITAVVIQQYQGEMNEILKKEGFCNTINLLTDIR